MQAFLLKNARVARNARAAERRDVLIKSGRVAAIAEPGTLSASGAWEIGLAGHLLLPGLINAHDHLEFNLFPRLGQGPYPNAEAWVADIYRPQESPIREHRRIPKPQRLLWGGLKNLLSGATTVCHHNPYDPAVFEAGFPVRVVKEFGWAHSLAFEDNIPAKFRTTPFAWPFIMHLAEGADSGARNEIFHLERMGCLDARTVLVHGVGIDSKGRTLMRKRGAALIWCPSSNLFTLGRTLDLKALRSRIPIALGTDSAITGEGDLLDELRAARRASGLPPERLYGMATSEAARVLRLGDGRGGVTAEGPADLLVVRDGGRSPAEELCELDGADIAFVIAAGEVKLCSEAFVDRLPRSLSRGLQPIGVEGRGRFFVDAGVVPLAAGARQALGAAAELRLAHKRVTMA